MKIQSHIEERWNWITHAIGVIASIFGFIILLVSNSDKTQYGTFTLVIYASSLLLLYFASTMYHYTSDIDLKKKFRVMDHISIYLLIAGTYSPVTLITLLDSKGVMLFIIVWFLAIVGSILKLFFTGRFQVLSVLLYLIMGWLIMLDIQELSNRVGSKGMDYLMYGGIAYTVGIIFYALKKIPFTHVIWHIFVLAGSFFHFMLILNHII